MELTINQVFKNRNGKYANRLAVEKNQWQVTDSNLERLLCAVKKYRDWAL
jgi:hypothetical protein